VIKYQVVSWVGFAKKMMNHKNKKQQQFQKGKLNDNKE
jgi:hypothetical protein